MKLCIQFLETGLSAIADIAVARKLFNVLGLIFVVKKSSESEGGLNLIK